MVVSRLEPKTSQTRIGRSFMCSAKIIANECGEAYINTNNAEKLQMGGLAMTKDADAVGSGVL